MPLENNVCLARNPVTARLRMREKRQRVRIRIFGCWSCLVRLLRSLHRLRRSLRRRIRLRLRPRTPRCAQTHGQKTHGQQTHDSRAEFGYSAAHCSVEESSVRVIQFPRQKSKPRLSPIYVKIPKRPPWQAGFEVYAGRTSLAAWAGIFRQGPRHPIAHGNHL
jgi:hypothetical protein